MFGLELITSSFLDLISKQARLNAAVRVFLFVHSGPFKKKKGLKIAFEINETLIIGIHLATQYHGLICWKVG